MSSALLLTSIALLLIFVSVFGGIKAKGSGQELVSISIRIPVGIVGMLLIMFMGFYSGTLRPIGQTEYIHVGNKLEIDHPVTQIQVISPLPDDKVECRVLTMGVYPEGMEEDIWVLIKPSDNRYYPQSDFTNVSYKRNGKWQVITRFGGDLDEAIDLIVYKTDPQTSQFFSDTIQSWKENLSYPGLNLEEIPPRAQEVSRLSVSLKDNCRGVF